MSSLLKGVNLYLVGMMGVGKSTTGRLLAQQLAYQFFDTDTVVEQAAGRTIAQIFAESGEPAFRQLETQVLSNLCAYSHLVIATGGGIILERENWSYLRHGVVVWLDMTVTDLQHRLHQDTTRPLLQTQNLLAKLEDLLATRQPLYAQADLRIAIASGESPEHVADRVLTALPDLLQPHHQ